MQRWRSRSRVACFVAEDAQGALAGCAFLSFTKPEVRRSQVPGIRCLNSRTDLMCQARDSLVLRAWR